MEADEFPAFIEKALYNPAEKGIDEKYGKNHKERHREQKAVKLPFEEFQLPENGFSGRIRVFFIHVRHL